MPWFMANGHLNTMQLSWGETPQDNYRLPSSVLTRGCTARKIEERPQFHCLEWGAGHTQGLHSLRQHRKVGNGAGQWAWPGGQPGRAQGKVLVLVLCNPGFCSPTHSTQWSSSVQSLFTQVTDTEVCYHAYKRGSAGSM